PGRHHADRGRITRPIEEAPPIHTFVLGARSIDSEQSHRLATLVDEVVANDADREGPWRVLAGGDQRGRPPADQRVEEQTDQHKPKNPHLAAPARGRAYALA